ncbi:protein of unknown function [Cellulosimicrobium cellulans]|nr:protein of unknown function [Cellulosimicrobium cellulans]
MRLEDIAPGTRIDGLDALPVLVVGVEWHGTDALSVVYRSSSGVLAEQIVYRADEASLRGADESLRWSFDADGARFKLAAEATRMRMAGLFDPMLAVTSSAIDPLPHQIRAVYGEMLPKPGPLRFLLADDPGAGKTIMAGLYLKELILRGDVARALIVAPGGLVEQWQDELASKFGLEFEILSRSLAEADLHGDPFASSPFLIARMDQLSRDEEWMGLLAETQWDLAIVDEAHRMSAHFYGNELTRTRRYELGQLLGTITRHYLLMTATPHAGKEEDFQLFLALLDPDRFEGRYRAGAHSTDTSGLMRRVIKEDLLTFEGKPLFPERVAETVSYTLSGLEMSLYEQVTEYVRTEMNRAERIEAEGRSGRARTVGFALTVLQRRLASSPEAIYRSLQRRSARLQRRRDEMMALGSPAERSLALGWAEALDDGARHHTTRLTSAAADLELDGSFDEDELDARELEDLEEEVIDAATAARTAAELEVEIAVLADLERLAAQVRASGVDRKWIELRALIQEARDGGTALTSPRKLIVFTEHRDTLEYLRERIVQFTGDPESVVTIHGGTRRQDRHRVREQFANDPRCQVLVATDAAGEGLNLQCAHLMVNYDLPWNPNRIEQRFGRIHRIGQREVCRLWNLVASETREGQVFQRLLQKVEEQRRAYGGKVFDVLGDAAFGQTPLRELLVEAIRYGEREDVRAHLDRVVDSSVATGLDELLKERALATPEITLRDLAELRRQMDEARARRLQPHYVQLFALESLRLLGGRAAARERGRYEITHVPATVRDRHRSVSASGPRRSPRAVAPRYARVTFEPALTHVAGSPSAELVAPGHPLMDALIDAVLASDGPLLTRGAVLVDPTATDPTAPERLVVALTEEIADGAGTVVSKRFSFVVLDRDGQARLAGPAPYLDLLPLPDDVPGSVAEVPLERWSGRNVEQLATGWSVTHGLPAHRHEVAARVVPLVEHTRALVRQRLRSQINYWDAESARLAEEQAAGRRVRLSPSTAHERARELESRLDARLTALDLEEQLVVRPPQIASAALVVPQGLVDAARGHDARTARGVRRVDAPVLTPGALAADTTVTERRAVDAVLAAERALGRDPEEMPHNNPGYDIRSVGPDGTTVFLEVKGRVVGAEDFIVTLNEVLHAKNTAPHYRLALVSVDHEKPAGTDEVRYVLDPFARTELDSYAQTALVMSWKKTWARGQGPL